MSHMFWANPVPFMRNGPIPTMPLRLGGRPVGYGGFFMAQPQFNRLDSLSIASIVGRIQLAPEIQAAAAELEKTGAQPAWKGRGGFEGAQDCSSILKQAGGGVKFTPMTEDERTVLLMVAQDPSSVELADLAEVDKWFTAHFFKQGYVTSAELCAALKAPVSAQETPFGVQQGRFARRQAPTASLAIRCEIFDLAVKPAAGRGVRVQRQPKETPSLDSKFFCSLDGPWRSDDPADHGVDPNLTWGRAKQTLANAAVMEETISGYPWPPPISLAPGYFWNPETRQDRIKLVQTDHPLDQGAVKVWITLNVIKNYESMASAIEAAMKRKAKKKKRRALLKTIGLAIAGIVISIVLPVAAAAVALAIKAAVETYVSVKERKKAAKAMADMAKQFEQDAPAFAKEVQTTAEIMDEATALQAADAPLTPEEQEAIDEDAEPSGLSPLIPISVAAAGAATAGALLFGRRP